MYVDLKSCFEDFDGCESGCIIELYLIGYMEKFVWLFNGIKFLDVVLVLLKYGEWFRIMLINDIMMIYFIYLYGMWSDLEDENGNFMVCKYIIDVFSGIKCSYRVIVDVFGCWVYYCYLFYYMEMGMFCEVWVEE